jgi:monoamine oxidase
MNRRDYLKLVSTILLSYLANTQNAFAEKKLTNNKKRIVVIGAGLAGLAAAKELAAQGNDVIVIEARDRIGGRIHTITKWPTMPIDLGASWIHKVEGNPLTKIAEQLNAKLFLTNYDKSITYNASGKVLSKAEKNHLANLEKEIFKAIKIAQDKDNDASIQDVIKPLMRQFDAFPDNQKLINFFLSSEIEHEYAGSVELMSAHWYDDDKEFDGDDAVILAGFKVITEYLASNLAIELGQVVEKIEWNQSPVKVITNKKEYIADQVVVTLPLGVLKSSSVRFTPNLSQAKQNAISKLGVGVLNKCYLLFPKSFWPDDIDWLDYVSDKHGEWTNWYSLLRANMPILIGFNAANRGLAIEKLSDKQIVASAMQTLKTIFGANIPEPTDYHITRWAADPYARGSYSYNAVGSLPNMRKEIAKPLKNKLFFAGEATNQDYFGTAHGAYLSGLRAAKGVLQAQNK